MDALTPAVVRATTLLLALFLTACNSNPVINTVSIPQSALEPNPVLEFIGIANEEVGVYAVECQAGWAKSEKDKDAIRKAVAP